MLTKMTFKSSFMIFNPMAKSQCVLLLRFTSRGSRRLQFGAKNSKPSEVAVSLALSVSVTTMLEVILTSTGAASAHVMHATTNSDSSVPHVERFIAISMMMVLLMLMLLLGDCRSR